MRTRSLTFVSLLFSTFFAVPALAQQASTSGIALDRFDPSERGSDWFAADSLDLRGHMRPAVGLVLDYAYKPLVLYNASGDELTAPVKNQMFGHLGGSLVLWDRLRVAANVPVLIASTGGSGNFGGSSVGTSTGAGMGDVRLGADARLLGTYGSVLTLAAGVQAYLPTGKREAFASDGKARFLPRVLVAGDFGQFTYSGMMGLDIHAQTDNFAGAPYGTGIRFAAGAGMRLLNKRLTVGPEVYGSTVVSDGGDGFFARRTTPMEFVAGGHYRVTDQWRVGVGVGPGLTRGVGTPVMRVLASVEWAPEVKQLAPPPPADTDGDGILDLDDACRTVPGVANLDRAKNGCPPPPDTDGDGIVDAQDACPAVKGVADADPAKNGCPPPPPDRDHDGILDLQDACPDQPGPADADPAKNGCSPPPDTDGDGIVDPLDACPAEKGEPNADAKKNGCPKAMVVGTEIKIMGRVEFDTSKATLRPESDAVLSAVLAILTDHPEMKKVSVEGHTDNRGTPATNKGLSTRRAAAVVTWLVGHGIAKGRLSSRGFGQAKPLDTNDTPEGQQNNRRVEFHIVDGSGTPATPPAPPTDKPATEKPATEKPATEKPANQ